MCPDFMQTIAVNKRNAGLPSAVPRATLNDEELVSTVKTITKSSYLFC